MLYEMKIRPKRQLTSARENDARLHVYGDPALSEDEAYLLSLLTLVEKEALEEYVFFHPGVPYGEVPELYGRADLFVNLSQTGSLDKAVLEAAASKILVLTSNEAFYQPLVKISPMLVASNNEPKELSSKIKALKELGQAERDTIICELQEWVIKEHDIKQL